LNITYSLADGKPTWMGDHRPAIEDDIPAGIWFLVVAAGAQAAVSAVLLRAGEQQEQPAHNPHHKESLLW
jgi:hypothetical protein